MAGKVQGMLSLAVKDKAALFAAYMPFIKNGGLFVPTTKTAYKLGDEVFMIVTLMNAKEKTPVAGKVVWVTPKNAHGGRQSGIGIQFGEQDNGETKNKIEGLLASVLQLERPTHTM